MYRVDALYDCEDDYADPAFKGYVVRTGDAPFIKVHSSFEIDFAKETDTIVQFMRAKECCEKLNSDG